MHAFGNSGTCKIMSDCMITSNLTAQPYIEFMALSIQRPNYKLLKLDMVIS